MSMTPAPKGRTPLDRVQPWGGGYIVYGFAGAERVVLLASEAGSVPHESRWGWALFSTRDDAERARAALAKAGR